MKRRTERERFFWHAIHHQARRHPSTMTEAEMDAITRAVLIERGFRRCRCDSWWDDARVEAEAQDLGVMIVHVGEAALDVCPPVSHAACAGKRPRPRPPEEPTP